MTTTPSNLRRRQMFREIDREVYPIIDRGGEPGSLPGTERHKPLPARVVSNRQPPDESRGIGTIPSLGIK